MRRALFAAAAAAVVLAAVPAAAQSAQELLGRYPLEVDYEGAGCPGDASIDFDVTAIRGGTIEYKIEGETDEADFHGPSKSFRKTFEYSGSTMTTGMSGRFTRRPDSIRLDIEWKQNGCTAKMAGFRPATPLETELMPPAPSAATPAGPADAAPAEPGTPPPATPADLKSQLILYGPIGLLLLLAGAAGGWFLARRKKSDPGD